MRKRNHFIGLWLDSAELAHLKEQCSISGLSSSVFIRKTILGEILRTRPPDTYALLLRQISGIGTNLNQIAHIANSRQDISQDLLEEAVRLARKAWEAVKRSL